MAAAQPGEDVRIVAGPYRGFRGTVEDVDPDRTGLRVVVLIFGRPTWLALDESKVERH